MRHSLAALVLTFFGSGWILGAEAMIKVREVEVRSKPSYRVECYPTGKLYRGDRVQLRAEQNAVGFLAIDPPPGSFSLISKNMVNSHGIVSVEGAETIVGSLLTDKWNVRGTRLRRGHQLSVLGIFERDPNYLKIEPVGEVRFIPVEAIDPKPEIIQTAGKALGRATATQNGEDAAKLQAADEVYREAEKTGDWATAKSMYEKIARGDNHEARMIAWNRLEFIRRRMQGFHPPPAPAGYAPMQIHSSGGYYQSSRPAAPSYRAPATPAYRAARNDGTYGYSRDNNRWSAPHPAPAAPAAPAASTNESRYAPQPTTSSEQVGWLERSFHRLADGQPLYVLRDSRGNLRCYVEPINGLILDPYVGRIIELQGGQMMYHPTLRQNYLQAGQVIPK